ncbi:sensor domain-containing phosphodiesterase [Shewanella surugensis]|uniref:Diguanylate cyclase n=1 Tax=Shewanella surugensis TaxID=212020 RepID=A0ABT0LGS9_9GAMM|nr:diguanylate cyclase [Shewanella surugensis]MCL1126917.1 diguanylate cyclase [Shewanella surugensis]
MFRDKTPQAIEVVRLHKRIARLKALARIYKRAEVTQNALLAISNLAATVTSQEEFYAIVYNSIDTLVPTDNFFIATLNPKTNEIEIPFFADEKDVHPQDLYPTSTLSDTLACGLTGYVFRTGERLLCDDNKFRELLDHKEIISLGSDCHQWLGVPIKNNGITSGVIVVQSYDQSISYGDIDLELMNFISHHISTVAEHLQHQEQLEQAISKRTQELSIAYEKLKQEVSERRRAETLQKTLFEIADLATSNIDNARFYAEIHKVISRLLAANNCFIALLNEQHTRLSFPFYVSQLNTPSPKPRPLQDGLTEFIIKHQKPRLFHKQDIDELISSMSVYTQAPELNNTRQIHQWIGIPLFIQGKVLGALTIYSFNAHQNYHEKDLELLTFVSQHIATAIERKLSAESLKASYEQLEEKVNQRTQALAMLNQDLEKEITQRKKIQRQLQHDAKHDNLTDLPNRSMFMEQLSQAIKHLRRHPLDKFALLFIDMDRFKLLNDTLGHLEGDRFLIETARRLKKCIRVNDTLARLGGDEFVILLDCINQTQDAIEVAERVLKALSRPYQLAQKMFYSSASIGIAISENNKSNTSESILRDADAAMYQAKSDGKGCYVVYQRQSHQQIKNIELEKELQQAISQQQLQLSYLPILDLRTQVLKALEPRLFWVHPKLGKIKQAQLNMIAQQCDLNIELDKYTLTQLNIDFKQLQEHTPYPLQIQISLSSQHLKHKHALRSLKNHLKKCQFNLAQLYLFFNEKAFVQDNNAHINAFECLTQLNVNLGINDYGSAHSAINSLTFLPVSILKLDPSYCAHLESEPHYKLAKAYFLAAKALDLTVNATGITRAEQITKLTEIGIKTGQGLALGDILILPKQVALDCA